MYKIIYKKLVWSSRKEKTATQTTLNWCKSYLLNPLFAFLNLAFRSSVPLCINPLYASKSPIREPFNQAFLAHSCWSLSDYVTYNSWKYYEEICIIRLWVLINLHTAVENNFPYKRISIHLVFKRWWHLYCTMHYLPKQWTPADSAKMKE